MILSEMIGKNILLSLITFDKFERTGCKNERESMLSLKSTILAGAMEINDYSVAIDSSI